jgi:hypothetical protein
MLETAQPVTQSIDWGFWQAIAAFASVAVVIVYTVFAILQWKQIRRQANSAGLQVDQMHGQLDAMREQSSAIREQGEVMRKQLATMENSLQLAERAESQIWAVRGFLLAIHTEIQALKNRYEDEDIAGILSLTPGQPFEQYFPIHTQSYFTVYDNGASLLGFVPDDNLRRLIVEIYLTARMIIDTHTYNNELLDERGAIENHRPIDDTRDRRMKAADAALNEYGHNIRQNYELALALIREFEKSFDDIVSKLEATPSENRTKALSER